MDPNTDENQFATVQVETKLEETKQPERLGPYLIQGLLGKGAMGEVFTAFHAKLKRRVALKVLPPFFNTSQMRIERFTREMAAVGRLDHPNVVRATDAGEDQGSHYIAMEFVHGADLQQLIGDGGTLDVPAACEVIRQAAMGLQHIRENDLVHRDIKPSNLMVTKEGVVKILDLGIARLRSDDELGTLTAEGGLMGTPDFIAPEQVTESGCVDIRADIYSLGCTFYRLLAGNAPFAGPQYGTNMAKVIAHTQQTPKCISKIVPDLPADLVRTIRKMMAREPKNRFQEPNQVVAAMCKWADATALPQLVAHTLGEETATLSAAPEPVGVKAERISKQSFFHKFPKAAVVGVPIAVGLLLALFAARSARLAQRNTPTENATAITQVSSETTTSLQPTGEQASSATRQLSSDPIQENGHALERIAHNSGVTANATTEISNTLKTLESTVLRLADDPSTVADQLIEAPENDGEIYHNAKTLSRLGRNVEAKSSYQKLLRSGSPYVDVHQSFQEFAIGQLGISGARRVYARNGSTQDAATDLGIAMLHDPEQRQAKLSRLLDVYPDFAPAYYELSKALRDNPRQTLADKDRELALLKDVKRLHDEGHLLPHYLDKSEAGRLLENLEQRVRQLTAEQVKIMLHVTARKFREDSYIILLQFAEQPTAIEYSFDNKVYASTGESATVDPHTGKSRPRISFTVQRAESFESIFVKYTDANGVERGPLKKTVKLTDAWGAKHKRALLKTAEKFKLSWISLGEKSLLNEAHFANLTPFKEHIKKIEYGFDVDEPDKTVDLDRLASPVSMPPNTNYAVVRLTFKDGGVSEVVRIDRKTYEESY